MEPKSQPAVPACCLRDCKLSLRMQTDKQDRHHLPILPSTTETVTHAAPSTPLLFLSFPPLPGGFFCPCTCMYMNSLIYFLYLPPLVLQSLSVDEMSQLAVYAPLSLFNGSLPLHRRQRVFGLFPLFYQFTSVILYTDTMSSHSSHRILLGSHRDTGSP